MKRLYLIILLLSIGCQQPTVSAEKPSAPVNGTAVEAELSKELKIYKNTLFEGKNEQIRIDAASVMLSSDEPAAREILLDALRQSENSAARMAVCKALSQTRTTQETITRKEDFIQPLLDALVSEDDPDRAKLIAEATLIFQYEQIEKPLERTVTNPVLPRRARLNAIYALKLQPDMKAIFKLMSLLDDDAQNPVSVEAEKALKSIGIPIGKNAEDREQIINELKQKGRDEFLRDRLIQQEARMLELENESSQWQKSYLGVLDKIFVIISADDAARGAFLAENLADSRAVVRLWALEKVYQSRVGGTQSQLFVELLAPALLNLISDQDRLVRLKTAELLSFMQKVNSAHPLLEQLKIEPDDEVKTQLFVALGQACYYAFLPNSPIKISLQIRTEALGLAEIYLFEEAPEKAKIGAEVIRQLLEQDGLAPAEVDRYLGMLRRRYEQQQSRTDEILRRELLDAMGGLCAQSVYKTASAKLFGPLFEKALSDESDSVREVAADGLIDIDSAKALGILRDFINDNSSVVREKVIALAGNFGGEEDLVWLAKKTTTAAESGLAWQAMLKIFKRSEAALLNEWLGNLNAQSSEAKLSDAQMISFLETAKLKLGDEELKDITIQLAQLYTQTGEFQKAAEYLGSLYDSSQNVEEKDKFLADLLGVYLEWPNIEAMKDLVENRLLVEDLDANSVIVLSIDNYLTGSSAASDPNEILKALAEIETADTKPNWKEQLKQWQQRFSIEPKVRQPSQ